MTVREVLLLSASFLDDKELAAALKGSTAEGEAETLLHCFNVIENEIALDDYPLTKTEKLLFENGILPYSAFERRPIDVTAVRSGGVRVRFSLTIDGVRCDCNEAEVTYTYAPTVKTITDESEHGEKISARLMAFGVVSEYCFIKGRTEEGKMWGLRYREALRSAGILRHPLCVRSRRWA